MKSFLIEPLEARIAPATLTISDASLVEGASGMAAMSFTVTLSEAEMDPVTVDFVTMDGTATVAGGDYLAAAGTLTFTPGGMLTQTITVQVAGDSAVELNETFAVNLTNPTNATLADGAATGTILADDFGIRVSDVTVSEGNAGTVSAIFSVTLEQPVPAGESLTVSYSTLDDTAASTVAGRDFDPITATTLTFAPGETVKTVAVTVRGDTVREATEQFFLKLADARLTGPGLPAEGQPVPIADDTGVGTITDDGDMARPTVSIGDVTLAEGNSGTTNANFTVALSQSTTTDTVINYSTVAGTASAGSDFTAATSQTVTIPAGQSSVTIAVPVVGDNVNEPDETFSVALNSALAQETGSPALTIADGTGVATITNDDAPLPTISIGDVTVIEGNGGTTDATFTVTLSAASAFDIVVDYSTVAGTATAGDDFTAATNATLLIPAGMTTGTIVVPVNGDAVAEADEMFSVLINSATAQAAGSPTLAITDATGAATIRNDESAFRIVSASDPMSSTVTVDEAAGTASFRIVREGDASLAASVRYSTVNGTAMAGSDFTAKSVVVNFMAGQTEELVTIDISEDTGDEAAEAFTVVLADATNAIVATGGGTGTVNITDNDAAPMITVAGQAAPVAEGNGGTTDALFTVTLSNPSDTEVRVSYATANGTATAGSDFTATMGELIFAPGETSKSVSVPVLGDLVDEIDDAEIFTLNLSAPMNATLGTPASGTVTITDDDEAVLNIAASAREGDTTVTATLSTPSERTVTANFHTANGTAMAPGDFTAVDAGMPGTVTFAPGVVTQTLPITITEDAVAEPSETFQVVLTNVMGADAGNQAVAITDNDTAVVTINDVQVNEGNGGADPANKAAFTLTLSQPSSEPITVTYATQAGTATSSGAAPDYTAVTNGTVTFAPGETSKLIEIELRGDVVREADETFTVTLGSASAPATIGRGTGTGTILNDDSNYVLTISDDIFRGEGDANATVNVTVTLSAPATEPVSFRLATVSPFGAASAATAGVDFGAASQFFTLQAGETSATLPVQIAGDGAFEANEFFQVQLSELSANAVAPDTTTNVFIFNDDIAFVNARTVVWGDEDGDLVKLTISKGALSLSDLIFENSGFGKVLQAIELSDDGKEFAKANLTIIAEPTALLGETITTIGNGRVDVGWIRASQVTSDPFGNAPGVDLGIVRVDGDLGRIDVGDFLADPAIALLDVYSIGMRGTETMPTFSGQSAPVPTDSEIVGIATSIKVATDVAGRLDVVGLKFGDIQNLFIGGALRGTDAESPGLITFTDTLGKATIGSIIGGTVTNSGLLIGIGTGGIGSVKVLGALQGGTQMNSGAIIAPTIGNAEIGRIIGGAGEESGLVLATTKINSVKVREGITGGAGLLSGGVFAEFGTVGTVTVGDDVTGGGGNRSGLIAARGGVAKTTIGGALVGGGGTNSGTVISLVGDIGAVTVGRQADGDSIVGGNGANSGSISANAGNVGSVTTAGNVRGGGVATTAGSGSESGTILAQGTIGKVTLGGALYGGIGDDSGAIAATFGSIGAVKIGQDLAGRSIIAGAGMTSAVVATGFGNIASLTTAGSIVGGEADAAGGVSALRGSIGKIDIGKNLVGGAGLTGVLDRSGFIEAARLPSVLIRGDVIAGESPTADLKSSGSIRAVTAIGTLTVNGDVLGNEDNPVFITAGGGIGKALAIGKITVRGDAQFVDILAGYAPETDLDRRGEPADGDAQIGTIQLGSGATATLGYLNIVAGAATGADGVFGTDDDEALSGSGIINTDAIVSRIAKVILNGTVSSLGGYGIVADQVASVTVRGVALPLLAGANNDLGDGLAIDGDDEFRARELDPQV